MLLLRQLCSMMSSGSLATWYSQGASGSVGTKEVMIEPSARSSPSPTGLASTESSSSGP